ncbi:hypothetical protein BDV39DRAFT_197888 [Aspergillus sergii]|uniref:Uncharacterized protein n=1 Tax=Aspergillus sergii TaxID=1034303 RepID=A0A5N6WNS5_9EURO|nr:hypothetical protein BDV39DRAFT_197888 [Aspergillus sergii]
MTKDGGDESPNHVGEWLLEALPGSRQSFRIIGMEEWATTPYLLTSHSVILINPTTLEVCSRIGSDVLTTILPRDKEILDRWTGHRVMACDDTLPVGVSYSYGCPYLQCTSIVLFTFGVSAKGPKDET